jgi:hypothetical protein
MGGVFLSETVERWNGKGGQNTKRENGNIGNTVPKKYDILGTQSQNTGFS